MYIIACILPFAYLVGLTFIRTHSYLLEAPVQHSSKETELEAEETEEENPGWSKRFSLLVLLLSTVLMGLISDELVTCLAKLLNESSFVSPTFVGLSFFAVIPSTAEFVSAIQFSLQNKISLSIEIGNSSATQMTLIQLPFLIAFSHLYSPESREQFPIVFPEIYVFEVVSSVIILSYTTLDGKSNYFQGAALIIIYLCFMVAAYFIE